MWVSNLLVASSNLKFILIEIINMQVAQEVAKEVYIWRYGEIDCCRNITCKENQVLYYGGDPKSKEDIPLQEKEKIPALQTSGVDFMTFWKLQDILEKAQHKMVAFCPKMNLLMFIIHINLL